MKARALVVAGASLLLGCGAVDPEVLAQRPEALYHALPSGPEDDAVVKLRALENNGEMLWCTATLIAPKLVLTAMHCVATVTDSANCTSEGELPPGSIDGVFGAPFEPSSISFHVGAGSDEPIAALGEKIFTTGALNFCKDDLAVVALDRELSNVPVAALRLGAGNRRGEAIRIVGFGRAEDGSTGVRKSRDDLKIQLLGDSIYAASSDPIPPNTFATIGSSVCNGDSGGPVFTTTNAVTGVVSHGASCSSTSARRIFTQLASYEELLLRPAFAYVGYDPIPEMGEGGAGGRSGDGGAGEEPGAAVAGAGTGVVDSGGAGKPASDAAAPEPPEKGGCVCSSSAGSGSNVPSARAAYALALGALFGLRRRVRGARNG